MADDAPSARTTGLQEGGQVGVPGSPPGLRCGGAAAQHAAPPHLREAVMERDGDLREILRVVSRHAAAARRTALRGEYGPAYDAAAILEELAGTRLDAEQTRALGPELATAAQLATAVSVLASLLAAERGMHIGLSGAIDELRAASRQRRDFDDKSRMRACLHCGRTFRSEGRQNRLCGHCRLPVGHEE